MSRTLVIVVVVVVIALLSGLADALSGSSDGPSDDSSSPDPGVPGFTITLSDVPGAYDWTLTTAGRMLRRGPQRHFSSSGHRVRQEDPDAAGLSRALDQLGGLPQVQFSARRAALTLREEGGPMPVPAPEHFARQLAVMEQAVAINVQANPR
jgi:hypothetical protein